MTPPRDIKKGQLRFVTLRAVNRGFRFVPTRKVRDAIWYCLAVTADKYKGRIAIHEFLWMSNHAHLVLTDIDGCIPDFMEELDSILSRALNALRGIRGTNIEKGYNLIKITSADKVIEHCVYTLTNAIAAHLVARIRHWKGVSSFDLDYGKPISVPRPKAGLWSGKPPPRNGDRRTSGKRNAYRGRSKLPEVVDFTLVRPAIMPEYSDEELRALIRERVMKKERELVSERKRKGIRVLEWRRVVQQSFWTVPNDKEPYFTTVPHVSGTNRWARLEATQRRRGFLRAYYDALARFLAGDRATSFPEGTWLMKERFGVSCCPLPAT